MPESDLRHCFRDIGGKAKTYEVGEAICLVLKEILSGTATDHQ
jgi:hypothetical protein